MTLFCFHCQAYLGGAQVCPACGQDQPRPADLTPRWAIDLGATTAGRAVAAGGSLFQPVRGAKPGWHTVLLALDLSTREIRWRLRLENLLVNDSLLPCETADGSWVLYVGSRSTDPLGEGALLALDTETGEERWRWVPGAQAISAPVLVDDVLYVVFDGDELCAVAAGSGEEGWRLRLPMPRSVAAAATSPEMPGRLFLPSRGPHLCAVDVDRRTVAWHYASAEDTGAWLLETPAVAGDRIYAASSSSAVLALDAATGNLLWRRVVGQAGRTLSAPFADEDRVYVGAYDGLYALDLAGGQEVWSMPTERRIQARPMVADGVVYAAGRDHHLYALLAATGRRLWQVRTEHRMEASPVVAGDLLVVADRGGQVVAVERMLGPAAYREQGRWEEAAMAHAWRGELSAAAQIHQEQVAQPLLAAGLWQAAGDVERAAEAYREAGRYDRAEACYQQLGQPDNVAEMAALQADHERAAALFVGAANWERARDCYEHLGDRRRVAEMSERLQDWRRAAAERQALQEFSLAAAALCHAGAWAEAAVLYEGQEAWQQAVACHEKAANWEQAGILQEERLKDFAAAACAFVRAARDLEEVKPDDRDRLVALWRRAEQACWRADDQTRAEVCRRHLARVQRLPYIEVEIVALERMVVGKYSPAELVLHNRGGGEAWRIVVHHTSSEFEGDLRVSMHLQGLTPGAHRTVRLALRPKFSGNVSLIVRVDYVDATGDVHQVTYRTHLPVLGAQEATIGPVARRQGPSALVSTFADFDLLLDRPREGEFPVQVVRSPAGEAQGTFRLPLPPLELESALWSLEAGETDESDLQDLGSRLFAALFEGGVGSRFRTSQGWTKQAKGLRLLLRLESPELMALPWELLYDPVQEQFLSLTGSAPVVRYLQVPYPTVPPPASLPLRMLVVAASPKDLVPLDLEAELAGLQDAVEPLVKGGALAIDILRPPTVRALRAHLEDHPCHIVHFLGHGGWDGKQGVLELEDTRRRSAPLDAQSLAMLFHNKPVRLVVLNACLTAREPEHRRERRLQRGYLGVGPALVGAGLLAVVGMQFSLTDVGACLFAEDFYGMLARHRPVDEAVDQARRAMVLEQGRGCSDWVAPVLFMRSSSGEIFPVS
jgi:outer membrane protein assembly factor BamB